MPYPNDCNLFYQNPLKRHLSSWNCLEQLFPYNRQQLGKVSERFLGGLATARCPFPSPDTAWVDNLCFTGDMHGLPGQSTTAWSDSCLLSLRGALYLFRTHGTDNGCSPSSCAREEGVPWSIRINLSSVFS